jgi:hypothetical protein
MARTQDDLEQYDLERALTDLAGQNQTSARIIRAQLETVDGEAIRDVRRILISAIEGFGGCASNHYIASCNSIANTLDEGIAIENIVSEHGKTKNLALGVRSAVEGISNALRMASRSNFRKEMGNRMARSRR